MATLYFANTINTSWDELGNWWLDNNTTEQATNLPTINDDVIIISNGGLNTIDSSISEPTVKNLSFDGNSSFNLDINITITDTAIFDFARVPSSDAIITVNGSCIFTSLSSNNAIINGNTIFDLGSINYGTINGDVVFNDGSQNFGATINGNVILNDSSYLSGGYIVGNVTFNNSSGADNFNIVGDATFNDSSFAYGCADISGIAIFNDNSRLDEGDGSGCGYLYSAIFNHNSRLLSANIIYGNIVFNDSSYALNPSYEFLYGMTFQGNVTFKHSS